MAGRGLWLATLAMVLSFAVWGLISAQSTRFQGVMGLSDAQTGIIIAMPVLMGSVSRIPMGILTETYGGRKIFTALMLFCVIPLWGLLHTPTYYGLLFWGFWLGMAGTSFAIGIPFVSKWFSPESQGLVLGIFGMGNIGTAVANFTVPYLNQRIGPNGTYYIYGAGIALFALLYFILVRDAPGKGRNSSLRESVSAVRHTAPVWILSLFYFLTFGCFVAMGNYLPKLLVDIFHISKVDAGLRTAGFVIVATLVRPLGGYLADRAGGHRVLNWVFLVMAGTAVILAINTTFWPVTVASLVLAAAAGIGNGAVFKLVPMYYPRQTGIVTGITGAAGGIGGFFPPLVMGMVRQEFASYFWGFIFLAIFAVGCWIFNIRKAETLKQAE
jgi:NNP family nitrate/nitrite transporter-like MFS transporter